MTGRPARGPSTRPRQPDRPGWTGCRGPSEPRDNMPAGQEVARRCRLLEGFDVPESTRRGTPRATRLMIDVFHAIGACGDLIHYWDVAKRGEGGVVVRATSVRR